MNPSVAIGHRSGSRDDEFESADQELMEVLEWYLEQIDAGRRPDRRLLLEEHPELDEKLAPFLDGLDFVHEVAPQLKDKPENGNAGNASTISSRTALGDYRIRREIGRGGMGVVYEAEQVSLSRRVALKVLPFAAVLDPKQLQRFKNEAQAAAHLKHPHIVGVYSVGCERGVHYYAMEFIEGANLGELIEQLRQPSESGVDDRDEKAGANRRLARDLTTGRLGAHVPTPRCDDPTGSYPTAGPPITGAGNETPPNVEAVLSPASGSTRSREFFRSAARLGIQAAEALEHAHELGVVHRDIKPSNLMVDSQGHLWVTDFGLALTSTNANLTMAGDVVGTLRYMSPEQVSGRRTRLDYHTDVYSLGLTFYELLTLTPVYPQEDRQQLLRQILEEEPRRPRQLNPAIPKDLETIVLKAMGKEPVARYATAQALADDLQRFLEDKPIRAKRPSLPAKALKWSRRHQAIVWPAVAAVILGFVAFAASTVLIASAYEREKQQGVETQKALRLAEQQERLAKTQQHLAEQQTKLAEEQKKEAIRLQQEIARQRDIAHHNLYTAQIRLGHQDWHSGYIGRLKDLLHNHRPEKGQVDRRGWEWYYLLSLCHGDLLTLRGHTASIESVAWSPTGDHIATASSDGTIKIWDAATGREILTLPGHTSYVFSVDWSPDGSRLLSGGRWGQVRVWDATTGESVLKLQHGNGWILSVAWTPDGRQFASCSDRTVKVWDVDTGEEVLSLDDHPGQVRSVSISPDGRLAACAGESGPPHGLIKIWDMKEGRQITTPPLKQEGREIRSTAWSPDGKRLAASHGVNCQVWDTASWRPLFMTRGNAGSVQDVNWSPDGERLAAAGEGGLVKVWGSANGKALATFCGHLGSVNSLCWSPDGKRLASASSDRTIKIWNSTADLSARTIPATYPSGDWSPLGDQLAVSDIDGEISIYDAETDNKELALSAELGNVVWLAWSPNGHQLAVGYEGGAIIKIWDLKSQEVVQTLDGFTYSVPGAGQWSPDGSRLAAIGWGAGKGGEECSVKVWNPATGKLIHGFPSGRYAIAWGPDGKRLAACGDEHDGSVVVRDAISGQVTLLLSYPLRRSDGVVRSLCWSRDGRWIASGYRGGAIKVWESATGRQILRIHAHSHTVYSLDWTPDGKRLASAGVDSVVKIWDFPTGQELLALRGHTAEIERLKWSPDGQSLATSGHDSVRIWDASLGYELGEGVGYYEDRAYHLAANGRHDEAIAILQKLVARFPDVPEYRRELAKVHFDRGDALFHQEHFHKAFPDLEQAIQLNPEYSEAYDYRGQVYLARGELDKAIADFSRAIRLDPKRHEAYVNRCIAYAKKGDLDKATADCEAIRLSSEATWQNVLAWRLATCPDVRPRLPDQTVQLAQQAVKQSPETGAYRNTLGAAQYRAGDWEESIKTLERAMELRSGGDSFDWFLLATAHWQLGHKEEARRWYDQAVEWMGQKKPEDNELRRFRAEAAALLGITVAPDNENENAETTTDGPATDAPERDGTVENKPDS